MRYNMVDFNNEATITTAPQDIVKIMILERRKYVIDAFEHYQKQRSNGIQASKGVIQSRLLALYMEWRATLKRELKPDDYEVLQNEILEPVDVDTMRDTFFKIDDLLDQKRVTRIDTIKRYDSSNVETENEAKGL